MQHTNFVLCMRHPSWRSQLSETTSSYLKFQKHVEKQWFQWSHHATAKKETWVFYIPIGNTSIPLIPSIAPCETNDAISANQNQFRNFVTRLQVTSNLKKTCRKTMVSMTAPCHAKKKYVVFIIPIGNTSIQLIPSFAPSETNDATSASQDR